ncbi:MAG: hypothetical protein RBR77_15530 [Thauera sp.]|jgi:hypothetical protein|nr:hypothetical protein [Thauera sp.]
MHIPFHVNALGQPVVTRAALIGQGAESAVQQDKWKPALIV